MTNTEHTALRTRNTKALALSMLAMLLAMFLALLAGPQRQADALIFYTVYTVNNTEDYPDLIPGDNACDALILPGNQCTLRAAIQESNATTGTQIIRFAIPGTGVQTIRPDTQLPAITGPVTIDGYTQGSTTPDPADDATENTLAKGTNAKLMVQLDGSKLTGESSGLCICGPDVVVKGLVINRFSCGVAVSGASGSVKIEGNFIGTDPSGTKAPGNTACGVDIIGSEPVTVGGSSPAARNLVSGNGVGVSVLSNYVEISGNLIGTQRDGKSPLGNSGDGVSIRDFIDNVVGGTAPGRANTIAFNGGDGIVIDTEPNTLAIHDSVLSNSIFSNTDLGIDLSQDGVTPNDAGDADNGPNYLQNKPVLSSAKKSSGKTTVKGKLNSTANEAFNVQLFSNPSGTNEGKHLLGSKSVKTDGAGNVTFTYSTTKKVSLGQNITATATKSSTGDSSEFSAPRKVVAS